MKKKKDLKDSKDVRDSKDLGRTLSFRSFKSFTSVVLLAFCTVPAGAQDTRTARDLKGLSIEELMEIDVTSVSRRREPFFEAASAVSVLTGEEIRRSGVTSLPQALRLINSLHVARQSQGTWAISSRG